MGVFKKPKAGPSPEEIAARQEAAAKAERERIAQEEAKMSAEKEMQLQESYAANRERRQGSAMSAIEDEQSNRRKFLKGV